MRPPEAWAGLPFFHDDLPRIAAALVVSGKATDLREGAELARESIDSGAALGKVTALAEATQKPA